MGHQPQPCLLGQPASTARPAPHPPLDPRAIDRRPCATCASTSRAIAMRAAVAVRSPPRSQRPHHLPRPRPSNRRSSFVGSSAMSPRAPAGNRAAHPAARPASAAARPPGRPTAPPSPPARPPPTPRQPHQHRFRLIVRRMPSATAPIPCATAQSRSAAAAPAAPRPSGCRAVPAFPTQHHMRHPAAHIAPPPPPPHRRGRAQTVVHRHRQRSAPASGRAATAAARPNPRHRHGHRQPVRNRPKPRATSAARSSIPARYRAPSARATVAYSLRPATKGHR